MERGRRLSMGDLDLIDEEIETKEDGTRASEEDRTRASKEHPLERYLARLEKGELSKPVSAEAENRYQGYEQRMAKIRKELGVAKEEPNITATDIINLFVSIGLEAKIIKGQTKIINGEKVLDLRLKVYKRDKSKIDLVLEAKGRSLRELYEAAQKFLENK